MTPSLPDFSSLISKTKKHRGWQQESQALYFLRQQGLKLLERNFRCRFGEIDLIMLEEQESLVFVEVRQRNSMKFGGALASITPAKQKRLLLTASNWLQLHGEFNHVASRFDVIAIQDCKARPGEISWIKNAFY